MFWKANEAPWGSCEWNSSQGQLTAQTAFKTKTLGIQRALKQLWTVLSCWMIHWGLLWSRTRTNPPWLQQGWEIFHTLSSLCRYCCALPQRLGYAVCPHPEHWGQWQTQTFHSKALKWFPCHHLPHFPVCECDNALPVWDFPFPRHFSVLPASTCPWNTTQWMCWVWIFICCTAPSHRLLRFWLFNSSSWPVGSALSKPGSWLAFRGATQVLPTNTLLFWKKKSNLLLDVSLIPPIPVRDVQKDGIKIIRCCRNHWQWWSACPAGLFAHFAI